MSPILVRPVREQLEHDRIVRLLQAKSRRKFEAGMNPGIEQNVAVGTGPSAVYPDLVLFSQERGRRLEMVIEVETGESVNHLEALAQWANLGKLKAAFHLYVPSGMVEVARRLCEDNQIQVTEIWSFHGVGDEVRFTLVHRAREAASRPASGPSRAKPAPAAASKPTAAPNRPTAAASKPTTAASKPIAATNKPTTAANKPIAVAKKPTAAKKSPPRAAKPAPRAKPAKKPARAQKRR